MVTPAVESHHEVTAQINQWRDGKNGRYAFADILNEGAPAQTATCNATINHHTPPTGEPFRAIIKKKANGNGYTIIDIIVEGLPAELPGIKAVVRHKQRIDLLLDTIPQPNTPSVPVILPAKLLNQQQIADIEPGTEVAIDAQRGASGYVASKLHAPSVLDAFDHLQSPQTIIVDIKNYWPGEHQDKKGCFVSYQAPGMAVTAIIWIGQQLLRGAGIPATVPMDPSSTLEPGTSAALLDQWQDTLRGGSQAEMEQLGINQLELELEWIVAQHRWRVSRLCRPRALRIPQDTEVIDWVQGCVVIAPPDADRQEPPSDHREPAATAAVSPSTPPPAAQEYVHVSFQDPRVGRGTLRLYGKEKIALAGLDLDTQLTFSLVGKGEYWQIKWLHRATPTRPEDAP